MRWAVLSTGACCALAGSITLAGVAHADDASFMQYLSTHGYSARYAGDEPIPDPSVRALGHMICENLHVGRSVAIQEPNYPAWPQFLLIAEAAQHELCPGA